MNSIPASVPSRPCRACQCPLVMAPNIETGKTLPLDRRTPVYVVFRDERGTIKAWDLNSLLATTGELQLRTAEGLKKMDVIGVHVSHFACCFGMKLRQNCAFPATSGGSSAPDQPSNNPSNN